MANSDSNFFDKLCDCFGNFMTMEQIAKFALTSKIILSYKIDFLDSFHDLLMKGLWKKASNGYIYPLDNRFEKILYIEINEDYEADLGKSLEKLRNLSVAQKVFDEILEPKLYLNQAKTTTYGLGVIHPLPIPENSQETYFLESSGVPQKMVEEASLSNKVHVEFECQFPCESLNKIQLLSAYKVLDKTPLPDFMKEIAQNEENEENKTNGSDQKHVLDMGCEDQDKFLKHERQSHAKLGELGSSVLQEIRHLVEERMKTNEMALKSTFDVVERNIFCQTIRRSLYDIKVGNTMLCYNSTLEDKCDFEGKEDMVLYLGLLCNKVVSKWYNKCPLLCYIFDPGGESFDVLPEDCDRTLLSSFKCGGIMCYKGIEAHLAFEGTFSVGENPLVSGDVSMEGSLDCVVHEVAILVFDPGGYGSYGDGHKVMEQPKACQNGGGKQLKDKRNEDHRIYLFDPGGPFGRLVIDDMVAVLQSGKYVVCLACCNYGLSLILEDKDRFKRRVLIHSKI